ncbi:MAG: formate dehydrogenase subunit gamma [Burkholderiales bacterium]|nr:formate dehydrogenase subunit gamma [Burkholderiales bacterium]
MANLARVLGWVGVVAAFILAGAAHAQPVSSNQELIQQQQQRRSEQPGNNAPVWREIRSGQPQFNSVPGRESGVLIVSSGQTWRALRDGPIMRYGGWLLVAVVVAIALYFLLRGPIRLRGKPTGRMIERFGGFERFVHWSVAITFCIMAITGLVILFGKVVLLPLTGHVFLSWLAALSKYLHNFVALLFILSLIVTIITFMRDNLLQAADRKWIATAGGLLGGGEVPSGRFNAGEKGWFWIGVLILGIVVSITGLVLLFPNFDQTRETMQIANIVHAIAAVLFMALGLGHIYMGTIGMAGAYRSMRTGYVDETWAKEHHALWYEDIKSGKIQAKTEQSALGELQRQH